MAFCMFTRGYPSGIMINENLSRLVRKLDILYSQMYHFNLRERKHQHVWEHLGSLLGGIIELMPLAPVNGHPRLVYRTRKGSPRQWLVTVNDPIARNASSHMAAILRKTMEKNMLEVYLVPIPDLQLYPIIFCSPRYPSRYVKSAATLCHLH